jgi:hypothetical protein
MSLAQFSYNFMSNEFQSRPEFVGAADGVGADFFGQKGFAAEVVAAMSNPAISANEKVVDLPEPQFPAVKNRGG